jgi:cytochrome c oxidase subunit 1
MLSFILFFLSGGLTGMWLSHVSLNVYIHDTFYVVAHFHFLFSAAVFSTIFGGIFHYYHVIFNYFYNKKYIYLMLIFWNLGQWMTFIPLYWVGYNGLPRRYHDYNEMYMIWHTLSTHGHVFTLLSLIFFFITLIESNFVKHTKSFYTVNNLRLNKRINYYLVKIKYNKLLKISWGDENKNKKDNI